MRLSRRPLVFSPPSSIKVYRHIGETFALGPAGCFIGAMIVAHFVSVWALYRVILRTSNRFDVATSQLAANATSQSPQPGAPSAPASNSACSPWPASRRAERPRRWRATAVLGTVAGYVVLPLGVLVAGGAGGVPTRLVAAMWSATASWLVLLVVAVALATRDGPWRWAGLAAALGSAAIGRPRPRELGDRLIHEREPHPRRPRHGSAFVCLPPCP